VTLTQHYTHLSSLLERIPAPGTCRTDLPPEVTDLARRLGAVGPFCRLVRLTQTGEMKRSPEAKAQPFRARQIIHLAEPGFLWLAHLRMAHLLPFSVMDHLVGDQAGLEGRVLGLVPAVRAPAGGPMLRAQALRYLSELLWAPDAILANRALRWTVIDPSTLQVSVGDGERRADLRITLSADGLIDRVDASARPRLMEGKLVPCPWFAKATRWTVIDGRTLPAEAEAGWMADGKPFVYWRGRLDSWACLS
jgi:hypothetical protein